MPRSSLPIHSGFFSRISICNVEQDRALICRSTATSAAPVRSAACRRRNQEASGMRRAIASARIRHIQHHQPESARLNQKIVDFERMLRISPAIHPENAIEIHARFHCRHRIERTRRIDPRTAFSALRRLAEQGKNQRRPPGRFRSADFRQRPARNSPRRQLVNGGDSSRDLLCFPSLPDFKRNIEPGSAVQIVIG